jgi:hypothetical protein
VAGLHRASVLDLVASSCSAELIDAWVVRITLARYRDAQAEGHAFWVAECDGALAGAVSFRYGNGPPCPERPAPPCPPSP